MPRSATTCVFLLTLFAILVDSAAFGRGTHDRLEQEFTQPPHRAKPWLYLYWMNGNLSRKGITVLFTTTFGSFPQP